MVSPCSRALAMTDWSSVEPWRRVRENDSSSLATTCSISERWAISSGQASPRLSTTRAAIDGITWSSAPSRRLWSTARRSSRRST